MMNISAPFVVRPIATTLLTIGLILLGVVAYILLPIAGVPQVDIPTIRVTANLPGANAETMATSVATPLERQFTLMSGVTAMSSASFLGKTQIQIEFDLSRNPDAAAQDVQAAINAAGGDLPKTLTAPPFYEKANPADFNLISIAVTSSDLPMAKIDDYVENYITPQLSRITGVGLIDYQGQQKPAIRVQIDPAVASAMDLSLEDVRAAIATTTVDAPKGLLDGAKQSMTLDATDQVFDAGTFNSAVITYRRGAPVRVADLRRAVDGPESIRSAAWLNGQLAAIIDIHKLPGSNIVDTIQRIKDALPDLQRSLPPSIKLTILSDRTQIIHALRKESVRNNFGPVRTLTTPAGSRIALTRLNICLYDLPVQALTKPLQQSPVVKSQHRRARFGIDNDPATLRARVLHDCDFTHPSPPKGGAHD
jgi:multidrug efflux pump subunit AcrB